MDIRELDRNLLQPRSQGFFPHKKKKSPGNEVDAINLTNQNTRQTFMWADQISWQSQGVDAKLCYCRYEADSTVAGSSRGSVKVNNSCRKQIKDTKKAV